RRLFIAPILRQSQSKHPPLRLQAVGYFFSANYADCVHAARLGFSDGKKVRGNLGRQEKRAGGVKLDAGFLRGARRDDDDRRRRIAPASDGLRLIDRSAQMDVCTAARLESLAQNTFRQVAGGAVIELFRRGDDLGLEIDGKGVAVGGAHLIAAKLEPLLVGRGNDLSDIVFRRVGKAPLNAPEKLAPRDESLPVERERILRGAMAEQKAQEARKAIERNHNS